MGLQIVDVQTAQRAYKDPLSFQPSTHQAASPAAAAAPSSSHPSSHTATSTFTALSSHAQHGLAQLPGAASSLLAQYAGGSSADSPQPRSSAQFDSVDPEEEKPSGPDPRDIDRVVGEMVTLSGRWGLYRRFVTDRLILVSIALAECCPVSVTNNVPIYRMMRMTSKWLKSRKHLQKAKTRPKIMHRHRSS